MYIESNWSNVSDIASLFRCKKSEIRFVRIPSKACFIIFVVGYLTINLLQNFPLSKSERERHLPIETPPGLKIFQDDKLKKEKLKTENKPEDGTEDIPVSSKSTSIGEKIWLYMRIHRKWLWINRKLIIRNNITADNSTQWTNNRTQYESNHKSVTNKNKTIRK